MNISLLRGKEKIKNRGTQPFFGAITGILLSIKTVPLRRKMDIHSRNILTDRLHFSNLIYGIFAWQRRKGETMGKEMNGHLEGLVEAKSEGHSGARDLLGRSLRQLGPERFLHFCSKVPHTNGVALWEMFIERRDLHEGPGMYRYEDFAEDILKKQA